MSWSAIKSSFAALNAARDGRGNFQTAWADYLECVRANPTPYHLQAIIEQLEILRGSRDRGEIRVLDHGCGGGHTLLYLRAIGYVDGYGVDVGGHCERWNAVFSELDPQSVKRFYVYEGADLPFDDRFFDFAYSEEVIEHVRPAVLEGYYADEGRVLKSGGIAFHRVPHRLGPYDSHTLTWFIHYLPRRLWLSSLRTMGRSLATAETAIFLRWPWTHRRLARKHIGRTEDRTLQRIRGASEITGYEGSVRLRKLVGFIASAPVLRLLSAPLVRNFAMLDTVSVKD